MENQSFEFEIVSPLGVCVLQVEWIDIAGDSGNFVVGPGHSELFSLLKKRGQITYKQVGAQPVSVEVLFGGIFKVKNDKAIVLLDQ